MTLYHYPYIHAAGDVEVIRKRSGQHNCDGHGSCSDASWNQDAANQQRFKTETFSLIDSLYPADNFTLMQPFDVVAPNPEDTFAAPTDTISDQTGILATDVTAPVTVLPDTTEVTQPTDTTTPPTTDEGVTPPVATEDSTTLGITPGFGSIEAAPLGTLGEGTLATPTTEVVDPLIGIAGQGDLETGGQGDRGQGDTGQGDMRQGNVLPESISTQSATDVVTPGDVSNPVATNPDEITPPNSPVLSPLGTTPSDNPTEVQLPTEIATPLIPPIEGGVQPLEVAPPEGWRPNEDGSVEAFIDKDAYCDLHPNASTCNDWGDDLGEEENNNQATTTITTGGSGNNTPGISPQEQEVRERLTEAMLAKHPEITIEQIEFTINMVLTTAGYYLNSKPDNLPAGVRVAALVTFEASLNATSKRGEDALKSAFIETSMAIYTAAAKANDRSEEALALLAGLVGFGSSSSNTSITPQTLPKSPYLLALAVLTVFVIANQEGINFDGFNSILLTELEDATKTQPIVVAPAMADFASPDPCGTPPDAPNLPPYEINDAHVLGPKYVSGKTVLPADAGDLFMRSFANPSDPNFRYVLTSNKEIYRYSNSNGKYHFSGSTNGVDHRNNPKTIRIKDLPNELIKQFQQCGFKPKGRP